MTNKETEIQLIKCIHNALLLPVSYLEDGKVLFSYPEKIDTAAGITGDSTLLPSAIDDSRNAQYILTPAGERCIVCLLAPGKIIALGPFLTEPVSDNHITQLIRSGAVKMHFRPALRTYFDSLPVMTMSQYYYTGKLVEMLFSSFWKTDEPAENADLSSVFIPTSYYRQAQDYRTRQFLHSPYMTEQEICHYISEGDAESALHILAEINSRPRAQLAGTALRSLKNSIICSCAFMARAAIAGGVHADDAFTLSDAYIQQIENCNDINTILHFEEKMVKGYTAAVQNQKSGKYSNAVSRAAEYIEAHLCEKLTLADISEAVYLNANYLSGLFKKETGETIHSFLIRRRVEDSAFFVRTSSEPIAGIASFYQFSSQSHYVQCFRSIMGITPGAYRKNADSL